MMQPSLRSLVTEALPAADTLIVIPPFLNPKYPSLAAHLLQALARRNGFQVSVFYANLSLYHYLGESRYKKINAGYDQHPLIGELVFARLAHYGEPLGSDEVLSTAHHRRGSYRQRYADVLLEIGELDELLSSWGRVIAGAIVEAGYRVVGCSSYFDQNNASIFLLKLVKSLSPSTVTIIGGANVEAAMAGGLAALTDKIDYLFSGESDKSFVDFLSRLADDDLPTHRIVNGEVCRTMDELPVADYGEYLTQLKLFAADIDKRKLFIPYETSRGCWWGQKHHCTFCGLNGTGMAFRGKSASKTLGDLEVIVAQTGISKIYLSDNIMPYGYFKTLLPLLQQRIPGIELFYEQKSNLSLDRLVQLHKSGVKYIQPGIESLIDPLLTHMKKGVSTAQNIALLRYAGGLDMYLLWNMLFGFPGEQADDYQELFRILPKLKHLQPPTGFHKVTIDRFSPYFDRPSEFGIGNLRPLAGYRSIYPSRIDAGTLAYHFTGDYPSLENQSPELRNAIDRLIVEWQDAWARPDKPVFFARKLSDAVYMLYDTRTDPATAAPQFVDEAMVAFALSAKPDVNDKRLLQEALLKDYGMMVGARYVPLATASAELLNRFQH